MFFWPLLASIVSTCATLVLGLVNRRSSPSVRVSPTPCGAAGPLRSSGRLVNDAAFRKTLDTGSWMAPVFSATDLTAGRPLVAQSWSPTGPLMYWIRPQASLGCFVALLITKPA